VHFEKLFADDVSLQKALSPRKRAVFSAITS
jgi:hypothetical protein